MKLKDKGQGGVALITGASGGLGLEFAKLFAEDGHNLILAARSGDKLDQICAELRRRFNVEATSYVVDLSAPEQLERFIQDIATIRIDYLVNNAGFGDTGYFHKKSWKVQQEMINLNILALSRLTHHCVQGMVQRGFGRILNIASTAAFQPSPFFNVYAATKSYVLSFTEALQVELSGTGVTATVSCPGPTETGFHTRAGSYKSRLMGMGLMSSEEVAQKAYKAMMKGKSLVLHGLRNLIMAFSIRFTPRSIAPRAAHYFMKHSDDAQ
jgi:short-subunit dehydrogenase